MKKKPHKTKNKRQNRPKQISTSKPSKTKNFSHQKRNHGRLAPGFAADAWELRYSAVLWVLLIRRRGFDPISAN